MNSQKSPGGSTFPYYYKGGEIHCLKYGSFHEDEEGLLELMKKEEQFIMARPSQKLRIWVDFYETNVTKNISVAFIESIKRLLENIVKLAIVGLSAQEKRHMQRLIKKSGSTMVAMKYFNDPEDAKTWLVSNS